MKNNKILIFLAISAFALASCVKRELEMPYEMFDLCLSTEVSSLDEDSRIKLYNSEADIRDKSLTIYGWAGKNVFIDGATAEYEEKWVVDGGPYVLKSTEKYKFFACSTVPDNDAVSVSIDTTGATLTVNDISAAASQEDILLGGCSIDKPIDGTVAINFSHPFASVKFKLNAVDGVKSIQSISLSGVYASGTTKLDSSGSPYEWTDLGEANATIKVNVPNVVKDSIAAFTVIPQVLGADNSVVMTVEYTDLGGNTGRFITTTLNDVEWKAGCTTTYSLTHVGQVEIEMSSGDEMTVTNNGLSNIYVRATLTGAWYIGDNIVAPWNNTPSEGSFTGFPGDGWTKDDSSDLYYYDDAVVNNSAASPLYSDYTPSSVPVEGAQLRIDVLFQAIPYDSNKTCREAFEAL